MKVFIHTPIPKLNSRPLIERFSLVVVTRGTIQFVLLLWFFFFFLFFSLKSPINLITTPRGFSIQLSTSPLTGRISDQDSWVRLGATSSFATCINLMPLDSSFGASPTNNVTKQSPNTSNNIPNNITNPNAAPPNCNSHQSNNSIPPGPNSLLTSSNSFPHNSNSPPTSNANSLPPNSLVNSDRQNLTPLNSLPSTNSLPPELLARKKTESRFLEQLFDPSRIPDFTLPRELGFTVQLR